MRSLTDFNVLQNAQQQAIEAYFDAQLDNSKHLKITVNEPSFFVHKGKRIYCVASENVEFVLNKYRDAGWKITGSGPWIFEEGQPKEKPTC